MEYRAYSYIDTWAQSCGYCEITIVYKINLFLGHLQIHQLGSILFSNVSMYCFAASKSMP